MKKALALALLTVAVAALSLAPAPASAIIPCEFCSEDASIYDRCIGFCNGYLVQFCTDYFFLGCSPEGFLTAPVEHPLDTLFPKPFFLQAGDGC